MSDNSKDAATMALARSIENLARAIAELANKLPLGGQVTVTHTQSGYRPPGGYGAGSGEYP